MILSWPLLVVAAIFFAAWMKPALPNGEWFQVFSIIDQKDVATYTLLLTHLSLFLSSSFTEHSCWLPCFSPQLVSFLRLSLVQGT